MRTASLNALALLASSAMAPALLSALDHIKKKIVDHSRQNSLIPIYF